MLAIRAIWLSLSVRSEDIFFLATMVTVVAFPLCMDVMEVMVVRMVTL